MFQCTVCPEMSTIPSMCIDQDREQLEAMQCLHSKAALHFGREWRFHWNEIPEIQASDESLKIMCNIDKHHETFLDDRLLLAAVQEEGQVCLLYTVSERQKVPLCEVCST